jgi:NAD+ diphosphatase
MNAHDNPNWFANSPLERINHEHDQAGFIEGCLTDSASLLVPLWRGDTLVANGQAAFLSITARSQMPQDAPIVFLGLRNDIAHFAIDLSSAGQTPEAAPFAEIGEYMPIRTAASVISRHDLAIIGHARWLFEWHRKHPFCAVCGAQTVVKNGGAKRQCEQCETEHFPRSDPVAIVLALHENACLLGRSPHFPPGFLSALAGYVEAAETPEEAAKRELFEEAGVTLTNIRYQFSQPWPFPSSLMMGFLADAEDRTLTLDKTEIEEARWIELNDIRALLNGEERHDIFLPPEFTIARQLIERWVGGDLKR